LASSAPPTPSSRPRGLPRRALVVEQESRDLPSWGSCLFRVLGLRPPSARSFSDAAPSRRSRAVPEPCGPASPGVLVPTNTFTSGAPSPPRTSFRSPVGDGSRQTPVGAVLRVLAPLDGSGQHAARSRSFDPAVRRGPRRFAAFFHAARVPGTSLQSFPFPGIRTRSRGPILPCGFRVRLPPAQSLQDLRCRFRRFAPALCP